MKTFSATVLGMQAPPAPAVQVRWEADFSSNGVGTDVQITGGATVSVYIPGGSYRVTLRATPTQGAKTGAAYVSQWPVCTPDTPLALPRPNRPGGC